MLNNLNDDDGRARSGREKPEQTSQQDAPKSDVSKNYLGRILAENAAQRNRDDKLLREKGTISHHHWLEAQDRVLRFLRQSKGGLRTQDFRLLLLFRDRINAFVELIHQRNGGEDEVEKFLLLFEEEEINQLLHLAQE